MWEILVTLVILSLVAVFIIAPIISIVAALFVGNFRTVWLVISIVSVIGVVAIAGTALIITHFEEKHYLKKADEEYSEIEDQPTDEVSTDKVLMEVYTTGGFGNPFARTRARRRDNPNISYVVKNYNDVDFKGTATIYLKYDGKIIDETEVEVNLEAGEEYSDYKSAKNMNVTRDNWYDLEFDYEMKGEFESE